MESVVERFMRYASIDTQSVMFKPGEDRIVPSCEGQLKLAKLIRSELRAFGVNPEWITEFIDGSFMILIPASPNYEDCVHSVFAAHLDTYFGVSGKTEPQLHNYSCGDISIGATVIPESDLKGLEGKQIITSNGESLLGGDDKAGIASIMSAIEHLILDSEIVHGPITFWFCTDEEIGELGIDSIPKEIIENWDILWTVDGEAVGQIDTGCFDCRWTDVTFKGKDAHPGVAGHKILPAHYAAIYFMRTLIEKPNPMTTSGDESFYYITNFEGTPSEALVRCAPRAFDSEESQSMVSEIERLAELSGKMYDVSVEITDKLLCINTRPAIDSKKDLLDIGVLAHEKEGYDIKLINVRAGTDGAMINMTYPDLPAPNMGNGSRNIHSPQEFVVVGELESVELIILNMVQGYTQIKK